MSFHVLVEMNLPLLEAPTHDQLDQLACFYQRQNNEKDAEDWICPNPQCRTANPPVRNVFVNVYHTHCINSTCRKQIIVSQDFKLTDLILNDIDIDFPAYRQDDRCCTAFALLTGIDLVRRMKAAVLYKASDFQPLDPSSLPESFRNHFFVALGFEPGDLYRKRMCNVMEMAQSDGVKFLRGDGVFDSQNPDIMPIKIQDKFYVRQDDTFLMKRLIASGFPLLATILSGNRWSNVGACEVYNPPLSGYTYGHQVIGHAILLHGSGTDDGGIYFAFRDTGGENCHRRWFDDKGADGRLRAGQFDGVLYGFTLEGWLFNQ
ncbi:hypothetical protein EJB05_46201 [Eragrostis curvula]|uniref:Peptidase C1A papain C-terminal domain-containing protein n=1 Tax=Eragrostis curvula TaxID=38414 RepID=A0A5J9TMJ6_9POAL|nr:hypothetical protein EJB05_46201 [Eragrostis curvula]